MGDPRLTQTGQSTFPRTVTFKTRIGNLGKARRVLARQNRSCRAFGTCIICRSLGAPNSSDQGEIAHSCGHASLVRRRHFAVPTSGPSLLRDQPRQPHEVVSGAAEDEYPVHLVQSAQLPLADRPRLFQPSKALLDQPSPAEAGGITAMPGTRERSPPTNATPTIKSWRWCWRPEKAKIQPTHQHPRALRRSFLRRKMLG